MKNLTTVLSNNFCASFFTLFISLSVFSQENKYTRRNEDAPVYQYTTQACSARSIVVKDSFVYTGNSNGALFATNLYTNKSFNLLENKQFGDMRDLEICGENFIGMQSGKSGVLAMTNKKAFIDYVAPYDGGWNSAFLDAMAFYGKTGFIIGDPKNGQFILYKSEDGGLTWRACEGKVEAMEGEVAFASSGTSAQILNDSTFLFVSGGQKSRFFKSTNKGKTWTYSSLPYLTDATSGAFSICMINDNIGVIVGGDYKNPELNNNTTFYTNDGGQFWVNADDQPNGYRSCVIYKDNVFYSCGTTGIDVSFDNGENWKAFALGEYYALCTDEKYLYATMPNGSFQRIPLIHRK
jgi:hypothetical protein